MYRCKECQAEYKEKVEYCECGNNTFDYIQDKPAPQIKQDITNDNLKRKSDIVSISFFVICLVLSILVWAFAGNSPKPKSSNKTKIKQQKVIKKNIPNINQIWDDTPLYQPRTQQYNEQSYEQQPEVINKNNPIPLTSTPAEYPRRLKPVIDNSYINKLSSQQKNNTKIQTYKNSGLANQNPKVSKPVQKLPKYDPDNPELLNYKSALRNALFSRFAVGSIKGSGTCIIEFSVNKQTGKLEKRRFVQQSDNKALNDSIYYMLMSVPRFKVPPASYSGEKFKMKFYLNNGYYEISYI
mgnify:CR=1 FL=1